MAKARREYCLCSSRFLSPGQCELAARHFAKEKELRVWFFGGYAQAQRRLALFVPDYFEQEDAATLADFLPAEEQPLRLIQMSKDAFSPALSHRDYLGAAMALGVKREMLGDILVNEGGCYLFALPEVSSFLCENLTQAGRATLQCQTVSLSQLELSPERTQQRFATVASLRLDAVIAEAYALSRSAAAQQIQAGIVTRNEKPCLKPDSRVEAGDIFVLRGKGKTRLQAVEGHSKKGRTKIVIELFT